MYPTNFLSQISIYAPLPPTGTPFANIYANNTPSSGSLDNSQSSEPRGIQECSSDGGSCGHVFLGSDLTDDVQSSSHSGEDSVSPVIAHLWMPITFVNAFSRISHRQTSRTVIYLNTQFVKYACARFLTYLTITPLDFC
jgi:hypothetical protein